MTKHETAVELIKATPTAGGNGVDTTFTGPQITQLLSALARLARMDQGRAAHGRQALVLLAR